MKDFVSGFEIGFGSSFWGFVLERCASFGKYTWKNANIIWDGEEQLQKLRRSVLKIEDLLKNFEEKMIFEEEQSGWKSWYDDLKELAYDADLLLDRISLHFAAVVQRKGNEIDILSTATQSVTQLKFPFDTSTIQKKLDGLLLEFETLVKIESGSGSVAPTKFRYLGSTSFAMNESLVGQAADMSTNIVGLITSGTSCGVISVVGAGGIGKTALARAIYNDSQLPFTDKVWVHIGECFDLIKMTKSVIEKLTCKGCFISDLNSLQIQVQSLVEGKRILLVLDDCWNESLDDWDTFSAPFGFSSTGNMAIVTTRSLKVSSLVSSDRAHQPELLTDDDCWELMKRKVLPCIAASTEELEPIGKEISKKKCRGLPLIANTLGGMLLFSKTKTEWISILEKDELWDTPQGKNVFRSLVRSYINLPSNLRKCFAYCSLFTERHEYDVEELVLFWMAEGLIKAVGSTRPEDLGRVYFNDLYSRSLFQKKTSNGDLYIMHPVVHDMARFVSKDTCLHSQSRCCPLFGNAFHLSLVHDGSEPLQGNAIYKYKKLKSLFVTNSNAAGHEGVIGSGLLSKCKYLRVFSLTNLGLTNLDEDTFKGLDFIRFLDFSRNRFSHLPDSICKLMALQTLMLINCPWLEELPDDMKNLRNLQHLVLDKDCGLLNMPPDFGELTGLRILTLYVVALKSGIAQLHDMDLRGSLCIKGIELIKTVDDAKKAKLGDKRFLNKLDLNWTTLEVGTNDLFTKMSDQAKVLNFLEPHTNLKEIVIRGYCGTGNPRWLSEQGRMFTRIHLVGLKYCSKLPCLGQLPCLETFVIENMPCVVDIGIEFYGTSAVKFPRLERFRIAEFPLLESWRKHQLLDMYDMPSLQTFSVSMCPKLRRLPLRLETAELNPSISDCLMLSLPTLP